MCASNAVFDAGIVIYRLSNQANLYLVHFEVHIFFSKDDENICSISFPAFQYTFYSFSGFCPDLLQISNGRVIDTSPSIYEASVEFRCNENFRLVGRSRLECIDGRWNGKLPFCESKLSLQSIVSTSQTLAWCQT